MKINKVILKIVIVAVMLIGLAVFTIQDVFAATDAGTGLEYTVIGDKVVITGFTPPEAFDGNLIIPSELAGASVQSIGDNAFKGCAKLTAITIPASVGSIGNNAFHSCSELASVVIEEGVKNIGESTFRGCVKLTAMTIPASVESIGKGAFYGCSELASMVIEEGVKNIGDSAFSGCAKLTAMTIPASVESIGEWAFYSCSELSSVVIEEGVKNIGESTFRGCVKLTAMTIPASVESIGNNAFHSCSELASVVIEEGVKNIGDSAFRGCAKLTAMMIPASVESIGNGAFYGCSELASVVIEEGVKNIGRYAFSGCTKLTAITIPASVESIGDHVFANSNSGLTIYSYKNSLAATYANDNNIAVNLRDNGTINPIKPSFDKNLADQKDVSVTIEWNDTTAISGVKATGESIGQENYSISENILIIKKDYLLAQPVGSLELLIVFNKGMATTLTVEISDTTPHVTAESISITGATGTDGVFKIGDNVTGTWDNTETGDHISGIIEVTMDFSQFGGSQAIVATSSLGIWTAMYTIIPGNIQEGNRNVIVTARSNDRTMSMEGNTNAWVDNQSPTDISMDINDGAANTDSLSVILRLTATEATEMIISEESDFSNSSYETYTSEKSYTLSAGDGNKTVYVKFRDLAGNETDTISKSISLALVAPVAPTITTTSLASGTVGAAYSQALTATGDAPVTWSIAVGSLPDGLSLNAATGEISGTPTTAGDFNVIVKATNGAGDDTKALSINISLAPIAPVAPTITTISLASGTVGAAYSQTLTATGDSPITWSLESGTLPEGVSLNSTTGEISGTPTIANMYTFTIKAESIAGSDTKVLSIAVNAIAETYTITFNTNGGNTISPITDIPSGEVRTLLTPTRANYRFEGWFDGVTRYTNNTQITKDVTLTAKWTAISTPGGDDSQTVVTDTPTTTADPTSPEAIKKAEETIQKLTITEKQEIAKNIKEYLPYTLPADQGLTVEQFQKLTNNKFTKEVLETIAKKPELLKALGIDVAALSAQTVLKPIQNPEFKDVAHSHWANDTIKKAAELGLVAGLPDGTFAPSAPLRGVDTFVFLDRVLLLNNMTTSTLPRSTVEKYITDKDHWAFSNMASIGSKLSEKTLKTISELGDQPISRELLAQILYELTQGKLEPIKEVAAFADTQNSPYKEAIDYCVSVGLLSGRSATTMSPQKALTRAELMTVLIRLDSLLRD